MNINQIIDTIETVKPNSFSSDFIRKLVEDCDKKIYFEFLSEHLTDEEKQPKRYPLGDDAELLLPEYYEIVYTSYVMAQLDYYNGEYERYNNEMTMYNTKLIEFITWFTRNHSAENITIDVK